VPALVARTGPLTGRRFDLGETVVLGRENATITLDDEETSRRHAEIRVRAAVVVIEDLGSTNGTFVEGRRIVGPVTLRAGETIRLGQTTFVVEIEPVLQVDRSAPRLAVQLDPVDDLDRTLVRPRPVAPEPAAAPQPSPGSRPASEPVAACEPPPRSAPPPPAPPPPAAAARLKAPHAASGHVSPAPAAGDAQTPSRAAPAGPADIAEPFGTFRPPAPPRRRGAASRKLGPTIVSFATILTTAAALVVYFAER
jgi:predicted component of type VI protein secretion system